jgi:hypothetical protein
MTKYQLQLGAYPPDGSPRVPCAVLKDDTWSIPFAPDNTDYQAYLKWLAEGNTPLPADNPPQGE